MSTSDMACLPQRSREDVVLERSGLLYVFARIRALALGQRIAGLSARTSSPRQEEATMINLPEDWFLYMAAGAMGLFMIIMMFVTIADRRPH